METGLLYRVLRLLRLSAAIRQILSRRPGKEQGNEGEDTDVESDEVKATIVA